MVCLERRITPHIVSRSASAHYRRSIKQWHHCSSSGVEDSKEIQFEKLVIQSIFPIEMILNKYFLKQSFFHQTPPLFLHHQHQTLHRNPPRSRLTSWHSTLSVSIASHCAIWRISTNRCFQFNRDNNYLSSITVINDQRAGP